ncbi:MAG: tandem-95 repeat protein, partial [Chloroflexi bacterium]|nr:tandem-95 repeat protein [Chloroflexota bacterium]
DPPLPQPDTASTLEDTAVDIDVLNNDSDPNGDALSLVSVTQPVNGSAVLNGSNGVTYTPAINFGGSDNFIYTIQDTFGFTATASVAVTILGQNDAPIGVADVITATEDTPIIIDVLANDTDIDGDVLQVVTFTQPFSGAVSLNLDYTLTYTPAANYYGSGASGDNFLYTVGDGQAESIAFVNIAILPANDAPVAADDTLMTPDDRSPVIDVLANDDDLDGDSLTVSLNSSPTVGTAAVNPDNTITYTPTLDFSGNDSFSYTASDGQGGSDTATVDITVFVPGPITGFTAVISPTEAYVGNDTLTMVLTAVDVNNNPATNYLGTVDFQSTGSNTLPSRTTPIMGNNDWDYKFNYEDAGQKAFLFAFNEAGLQTVSAYAWATPTLTTTTNAVTMTEVFLGTIISPSVGIAKDQVFTVTIEARDVGGALVPSYGGSVEIVSSGPSSGLPNNDPPFGNRP